MSYYPALFRRAAALVLAGALPFASSVAADLKNTAKAAAVSIPNDPAEFEFRTRRIVRLTGEINTDMAEKIIRRLEYLDALGNEEIELRINSYGGQVDAGLAIYDTMRSLKSPVRTVCEGASHSMGAYLLAAGAEGRREARPNCSIMVHEPSSDPSRMTATEQRIYYSGNIESARRRLTEMFSLHTGISLEQADRMLERDKYMTPTEALQYGIIDRITPYAQPAPKAVARTIPEESRPRQRAVAPAPQAQSGP